jgi:nicotinate-nucleotide--dimethylbenzimidazole phosphoribosyltransferase
VSHRDLARAIVPADRASMEKARTRHGSLTKPPGSLGRLEDLGIRLAGIAGRCPPPVPSRKSVILFAADHGVVAQGVSAFPQEVTPQMVRNILAGGAAVSSLARQAGARLVVVDAGVAADMEGTPGLVAGKIARGTADMSLGPAMSREQAEAALDLGARLARAEIESGVDLVACGEMGIGNTTPATAIVAVLCGAEPAALAGPGTGLAAEGVRRKAEVIARAIAVNRPDPADGLDVLAKVGGFEIAAMTGAMLACAAARVPVVLDGLIATAAALAGCRIQPLLADYLVAGHRSAEPSHGRALAALGLEPLLDLGMRLGEGSGAVLAFPLVEAAARVMREMATFASAGVSAATDA